MISVDGSVNLDLSIVVPVHNERENVAPLYQEIKEIMGTSGRSGELIFVDDGSTDGTFQSLQELYHRQPSAPDAALPHLRLRVVRLQRWFGKTAALAAGFRTVQGKLVIIMDGDLQDDPREIPRFLDKMAEGFDLVCGWRKPRHDPPGRIMASKIFNLVVSRVWGVRLHDLNSGFKALSRELLKDLRLYGGLHRFIPVLAQSGGFRLAEIVVAHRPRRHGHSKVGYSRLLRAFLDLLTVLMLTRFACRPLHFFGGAGLEEPYAIAARLD